MAYDWNGARTRRIRMLKIGVSLLLAIALLGGPAMLLV